MLTVSTSVRLWRDTAFADSENRLVVVRHVNVLVAERAGTGRNDRLRRGEGGVAKGSAIAATIRGFLWGV